MSNPTWTTLEGRYRSAKNNELECQKFREFSILVSGAVDIKEVRHIFQKSIYTSGTMGEMTRNDRSRSALSCGRDGAMIGKANRGSRERGRLGLLWYVLGNLKKV